MLCWRAASSLRCAPQRSRQKGPRHRKRTVQYESPVHGRGKDERRRMSSTAHAPVASRDLKYWMIPLALWMGAHYRNR